LKRLERSVARAGVLIAVLGAAVAVLPATASATTAPLSITASTSWLPATGSIANNQYFANVGGTYGITYTLKAASGDTLTNVGFTDALPAGVVLDDEVGETAKNCGTLFTPSNQPGASSVSESGLTVTNSVGSCTITLEFVANTAEGATPDAITPTAYDNTPSGGPLTPELASTASVTDLSLTVAGLPTLSVTGLTNNATYGYGQSVDLGFSATAAANDSIAANGVYATDDQGNTLSPGAAIDTDVPGGHQVEVWVETVDQYEGSQTYNYTVNSPKLTAVKANSKTADVTFDVDYLAAGSVLAEVVDGKTVIGKVTKKVAVGKNTAVTVAPTAAGKKFLAKLTTTKTVNGKTKTTTKSIKATLTVLYTASDYAYVGSQPTIKKSGITLK
jgi:uncharacterized repeat protein (TIGR01451 family)